MIEQVVSRARRRFILNDALSRAAGVGFALAAGVALILILGTGWLDWPALSFIAIGIVGMDIWLLRRAAPSPYAAAMRLDRAAGLNDSLSTALHFTGERGSFAEVQRKQAEDAARAVDVSTAVPLVFPRELYWMGAMLLLAGALFALRYGRQGTLDLRAPLTQVFFEDQAAHPSVAKQADAREALRRKNLQSAESLLAKIGVPIDPDSAHNQEALDRAIEQALAPPGSNPGDKGQQKSEAPGKAENGANAQQPAGDPMDEKPAFNPPDNANKGDGDKGSPKSGSSGDNSSLLSKLKDAVSNMFSKASPNKEQNGEKGSSQQPDKSAKAGKGKGEKSDGKGQDGESSADAQDGQQDADAKDGQDAQAKAASKNAQQPGQAGSGVGNQDGLKELRAAEQLRAMGKISEIIGKRAATVTGETMIEVQSGNQKLSTAYSNRSATHRESDGEVSRDEIPVDLQPYIRQYFEQVHKAAPAGKTAAR